MWVAAGQFFSGLITTKPPVEKNSEGLWGKRWGEEEAAVGSEEGKGKEGKWREEITAFENVLNLISLVDFIYGSLHLTFNNYL